MPILEKQIAGIIVFNTNLDVLVLRKPNGRWDLPKGHVDPGEALLIAAMRECDEETGLFPNKNFDVYPEFFIDVESKSFVRFFLGITMHNFVKLSKEHERHYWLDVDSAIEAFESDGNPDFADAIEDMYILLEKNFG